jgi:hypothetical protein
VRPQRHGRLGGVRLVLESGEQLLCLVEATLQNADLREPRGRMDAAGALARVGQLAQSLEQLLLGGVDAAVRRRHVRAAAPAEGEERNVVVGTDERLEDLAPLPRPLVVACPLAGEDQRAADVRERLERRRLAARRGSHRLVEAGEALVDEA